MLFALLTKNLIVVGELGPALLLELLQLTDARKIERARATRRLRMTDLPSNLFIAIAPTILPQAQPRSAIVPGAAQCFRFTTKRPRTAPLFSVSKASGRSARPISRTVARTAAGFISPARRRQMASRS